MIRIEAERLALNYNVLTHLPCFGYPQPSDVHRAHLEIPHTAPTDA